MPNPFSPKPGTSWRNPSPRNGPQRDPESPRRDERAGEEHWRRYAAGDTLPADQWDAPAPPLTPAETRLIRTTAIVLSATLALSVLFALALEARKLAWDDCAKRLPGAAPEVVARVCGGKP